MDPISVLSAVYSLASTLVDWIDQRQDHDVRMHRLSAKIHQITSMIKPLQGIKISDPSLISAIQSLGDCLRKMQQSLIASEASPIQRVMAIVKPSILASNLKDAEEQLNQQLVILVTAMIAAKMVQDEEQWRKSLSVKDAPVLPPSKSEDFVLEGIHDPEVWEFWHGYIGGKISFVSSELFCQRLPHWYGKTINNATLEKLLYRLDEFAAGGVTPFDLQRLVGETGLRRVIETYDLDRSQPIIPPQLTYLDASEYTYLQLPILVWIDDKPSNNTFLVEPARKLGITVLQIESTGLAKAWIEANEAMLRANDSPSRIRFISDNSRFESASSNIPADTRNAANTYLNHAAGKDILRYLRGRQYNFRVLIFTSRWGVEMTEYVEEYDAGSTCYVNVCEDYIKNLARGEEDDVEWMRYGA